MSLQQKFYNVSEITLDFFSQWNALIQPELDAFEPTAIQFVLYFVYVALAVFVLASFQTGCWTLQAVRWASSCRSQSIFRIDC